MTSFICRESAYIDDFLVDHFSDFFFCWHNEVNDFHVRCVAYSPIYGRKLGQVFLMLSSASSCNLRQERSTDKTKSVRAFTSTFEQQTKRSKTQDDVCCGIVFGSVHASHTARTDFMGIFNQMSELTKGLALAGLLHAPQLPGP